MQSTIETDHGTQNPLVSVLMQVGLYYMWKCHVINVGGNKPRQVKYHGLSLLFVAIHYYICPKKSTFRIYLLVNFINIMSMFQKLLRKMLSLNLYFYTHNTLRHTNLFKIKRINKGTYETPRFVQAYKCNVSIIIIFICNIFIL